MAARRYCAFISYRHADNAQEGRRWAEWLHRALERYVVPPDLIGAPNERGMSIPASLYPIFRDEDELPANADLATGIRAALEVSDHLIVLCSPRSALSPWVRKEVREFKELGRSDRLLAVMIAGEPNADDPAKARDGILPEEECFCEELRFGIVKPDGTLDWTARTEPLAADLRPGGMRAEGFVSADAYREHLTLHSSLAPEKIAAHADAYHARLELGLLKEAQRQREIAERERALAQQAEQAAERERETAGRLRKRNRILTVAAVIIFFLAAGAAGQWKRAERATRAEGAARQRAEIEKIAAGIAEAEAKKQANLANASRRQAEAGRAEAEIELYRSNILLGDSLIREGKTELAEERLWSAPEKKRGWEWGYLLAQCNKDLGRFAANPGEYVGSMNSYDGRTGIFWQKHEPAEEGKKPGPTKLWVLHLSDAGIIRERELEVPGAVISVESSADSKRILLVTEGIWGLYDATLEKVIATGECKGATAGNFVESTGQLFIVASEKSWSLFEERNSAVNTLKTAKGDFNWSRIVGDGRGKRWVLLNELDGQVEVYGMREGKLASTDMAWPSDAAFSPDGQRLAVSGRDESLVVWDGPKSKNGFVKKAGGVALSRSQTDECLVAWSKANLLMCNAHGLWSWEVEADGKISDEPEQTPLQGAPYPLPPMQTGSCLGSIRDRFN